MSDTPYMGGDELEAWALDDFPEIAKRASLRPVHEDDLPPMAWETSSD